MAARPSPKWQCPKCGRRFARARQAHSCQVVPLATHLRKASAEVRRIYHALLQAIRDVGPVQAVPTKTGINLLSGTSLGGIGLHRDFADVGLVLTRRVDHPRIMSVLQISRRSYVHRVRVRSASEVDGQLRTWLREAYQVGLLAGRRPP